MLKYQLKKGVTIEPGMAFKYKSIEELKALLSALGRKDTLARATAAVDSSLKEAGLLIFSERNSLSGFKEENKIQEYITRKHLVRSNEYIVRKKDFFDKTEYDNGPKNNKGSVGQYDNASNLREQNDVNNNACPNNTAEPYKPFVAYALTDGCGFRVPVNRAQETLPKLKANEGAQGFFDMLHSIKTIVSDGVFMKEADQYPFTDKMYIVGMETDRIKKLVASKFPLFIRTGIYNIGSDTPSVSFKIPGTFFDFRITLEGEKVIDIQFSFEGDSNNLAYTNVLKELIARYFNLDKQKPKEGTKFEAVTDKNGDTRILMTDSLGNKSTLI